MNIVSEIKHTTISAVAQIFKIVLLPNDITVNATNQGFHGDYTVVLFALSKTLKQNPDHLGKELGNYLVVNYPQLFSEYNVVKGFLNLSVSDRYWFSFIEQHYNNTCFGLGKPTGQKVMVEYSSPNTNKPLHLGHLRNNFLGWSIAEILKASGEEVVKTCIVNDRGIHICKSMVAWQLLGNGETPDSKGMKGDHFVGDYYVKFNDLQKEQVNKLVQQGIPQDVAEKQTPIMQATQQMLLDWEAGDEAVLSLWRTMNGWVYEGFDATYKKIGSDFDKTYYESNTYLLGKDLVASGLANKIFFKKEDGSVWIDLTHEGLDEKLVQRKDGTSVYITQDIGLAVEKQKEFNAYKSIYVVGDEQNYHFKVLKLICQLLNLNGADGIYHLSYGMVELPSGKMKSREGTVVDADELIDEMLLIAKNKTEELGKVGDFSPNELDKLYQDIGIGALKYFLLRVDPKKKMIFNPEESIDFHGFTAPFIQYTYARIKSILRKVGEEPTIEVFPKDISAYETTVIKQLEQFPWVIETAANTYDPSQVAVYIFNLAKVFNSFYAVHSITNAETYLHKNFRLAIANLTSIVIQRGMHLLGIQVPEKM